MRWGALYRVFCELELVAAGLAEVAVALAEAEWALATFWVAPWAEGLAEALALADGGL